MPPKKAVEEPKLLLGKPKGHLKMGIVGVPNVGKSTLFNVLTKLSVPAENYPFCTVDPNAARIIIADERFDWLVNLYKPKSEVPAYLEVVDIAGLIKGAAEGEGLGNAFLSHIASVDGIYYVVRIFDDPEVIHVEGDVDPVRDLEIITEELLKKDIVSVERAHSELAKVVHREKHRKGEMETLEKVKDWVCVQRKPARHGPWKAQDIDVVNSLHLLTAKPGVFLVNMSEPDFIKKRSSWLPKIKTWIEANAPGEVMIPFCGKLEASLIDLGPEAAAKYCHDNGTQSNVDKITKAGFSALNLIQFFTTGADEVRSWVLRRYTPAPKAAGTIHSDMEHGFICAEVFKYDDLKEHGSEAALKAAGKLQQQGKGYEVQDGDCLFFKFSPPNTGKKK